MQCITDFHEFRTKKVLQRWTYYLAKNEAIIRWTYHIWATRWNLSKSCTLVPSSGKHLVQCSNMVWWEPKVPKKKIKINRITYFNFFSISSTWNLSIDYNLYKHVLTARFTRRKINGIKPKYENSSIVTIIVCIFFYRTYSYLER